MDRYAEKESQGSPGLIRIGTAGWSLPKDFASHFPLEGTHLERYASRFNAVEINSSFYRDHQAKTYARWSACTPENFRFSVKLSKRFTHDARMHATVEELDENMAPIKELGPKLSVLLVQIPPSLNYEPMVAKRFFENLREVYDGPVAFEPRHPSWTSSIEFLQQMRISKVIADPEPCPFDVLGAEIAYYRWHGTPVIYRSRYDIYEIQRLAKEIRKRGTETWCIFDNTTFGFATDNARELTALCREQRTVNRELRTEN